MSWLFKSNKTYAEQDCYPDKAYRRALCTRKHCTENCEGNIDAYKFWALFLAGEKFKPEELKEKINLVPYKLRMLVYAKFSGELKVVDSNAYNFYLKDVNNKKLGKVKKKEDNEEVIQQAKYVKKKLDEDKRLVIDIFKLCKKYKYKNEEDIFNIYKSLSKNFNVDKLVLQLIFNFIKMPGAIRDNVYTLMVFCFSALNLNIFFENDEQITFEEKENINKSFDSNELEENISKNGSYNNLFDAESDAKIQKEKEDTDESMSLEKMKQILELLITTDFDTFLVMLDVALTSNLTIEEVIHQANEFSKIDNSGTLIKVLGARANMKYYKAKKTRTCKTLTEDRKDLVYFDFLIILNESIKAQENMKERYEHEICALKNKVKK